MNIIYICKKCGNLIKEVNENILKREYQCKCGDIISMANSYPPLNCQDFVLSVNDLMEQAKLKDKENVKEIVELLEKQKIIVDKTEVDSYLNFYDKIRLKYDDNDPTILLNIHDDFEEKLSTKLKLSDLDDVVIAVRLFSKNKFRKPIVIMIASIIEHLFNDYFKILVKSKLPEFGANYFLKKYDTVGIQSCIDISNSFLNESIKDKIEYCIPGFYDKWSDLRKLRNNIVHTNSMYISKLKILELFKLVDDSIDVFSKLISNIYESK